MKPNIILMSVGHAGSSVVAEMICRMGWVIKDSEHYRRRGEIEELVSTNVRIMSGEEVSKSEMVDIIKDQEEPFVMKDPRFTTTLSKWAEAFKEFEDSSVRPLILIRLTKDMDLVKKSFLRRGQYKVIEGKKVAFWDGTSVDLANENCEASFEEWEGLKLKIRYEDIKHATSIFDVSRDDNGNKSKGKSGFVS